MVKIKDNDGGVTEYAASFTINNDAPTVTAPIDQSANEGASTSFLLGSFGDPGADSPWAVDINWGDGSTHLTFNQLATGSLGLASHTYADNTTPPATGYTVPVQVTDKDGGTDSKTFKITVNNVAPTVTTPTDPS